MIGTPLSFAGTPDQQGSTRADLLSDMLKSVRLTGSVFLNARFTAPFGVIDPTSYGERTPMARLRHISILHLIVWVVFEVVAACDRYLGRRSVESRRTGK